MDQLHVFFFPFLANGHILPTIDMAKLFSSRGVKATLITTHNNSAIFLKAISRSKILGFDISVLTIKFPSAEFGLPEGYETADQARSIDLMDEFFRACILLQEPLEELLKEHRPQALVADLFFYWANDAAAKFGIPRLLFHGSSSFAMISAESVRRNKPYKNLSSDSDPFVVPDIPDKIILTKSQVPTPDDTEENNTHITEMWKNISESENDCYGVIVNSFYELEPDYVDYCKNVLGRRAWHIGPLLLCNNEGEDVAQRGEKSDIDAHEYLNWLDSKNPYSVVYVCFGSMANFNAAQLHELAMGLEESGQEFIWVVRTCVDEKDESKWFPDGFEKRVQENNKGLIIKGWAPQVLILEHEAVGAFVSHCGWNSTLEGICGGVAMVTWPLFAEQFYNEKLMTDILRTGVPVGSLQWSRVTTSAVVVKREAISKAVRRLMAEEEGVDIRNRAKALKEKAKKAVEEGGSSYSDLSALLDELSSYPHN
uniref:UDP-glucose:anthocyanin 3'-O-glucosyltransferase n=1 Tax=Gentiana scabra var. buergeri TaxID=292588 RepID=Q65YR5_9GENT|nr:UDP-glucose:anthocyanin 3'-O-glucosyltransferase [Gentiana scabra var. buergeri]